MSVGESVPKLLEDEVVNFPEQPLNINFMFSRHKQASDIPTEFQELTHSSDLIIIEGVAQQPEMLALLQRLSDGDEAALAEHSTKLTLGPEASFVRKRARLIFGSGAQIHNPEPPIDHPAASRYMDVVLREQAIVKELKKEGPVEAKKVGKLTLSVLNDLARAAAERDKYIISHLFPTDLRQSHGVLNVLMLYGAMHKHIADVVAKEANRQQRTDINVNRNITSAGDLGRFYDTYLAGGNLTLQDAILNYGIPVE